MSINLSLLAGFAAPAKAATSVALHTMTLAQAREIVKFEDRTRSSKKSAESQGIKVSELPVQNISVYCGKQKLALGEIEGLPNTPYLAVPSEQLETVVETLQTLVSEGAFDSQIESAIQASKDQEAARVAKVEAAQAASDA